MTAGQFREVDQNLLADYVGGALAGTPDEAVVARLIAEDRAWAESYAALAPAVNRMREALADWGTADLAMPPEVVARLADTLAAADPITTPASAPASPPAGVPVHGPVVPSQAGRGRPGAPGASPGGPRRPPARARRRWPRWAGAITAAAAVAAFAALIDLNPDKLARSDRPDVETAAGREEADTLLAPESAPPAARAAAERVVASGTDYTPATLAGAVRTQARTGAVASASGPAVAPLVAGASGLDRLADDHALTACLDEVARAHGRGPLSIDLVDLATFEQAPAVVISFVDSTGERWVWVAGPACGSTGADTRYRTRVG